MKRINHSITQTDLPLHIQILNISVNMARISQWVFDNYLTKRELIQRFLNQTDGYLSDLYKQNISDEFLPTLERFKKEFKDLKGLNVNEKNKLYWAEKALTWANILQHRAKLA